MAAVHSTARLGSLRSADLHPALRPFVRGSLSTQRGDASSPSASSSSRPRSAEYPSRVQQSLEEDGEDEEDELDFEFEYATEDIEQEYARSPPGVTKTEDQQQQEAPFSASAPVHSNESHHAYPPPGIDSATPAPALAQDQPLHDALSSELLRLSTVLKSNAVAFGATLERDRLLLAKSSDLLGANLDFMTRTRGRLGEYSRRARGMGWFTLGSIAIVMVSWVLCFILIRLT
ncbi:unnamed protein product [Tilletia controversa]|uniref:Uncharacterized protein n=1 Tax=Tilletia controversa TaxID=13291 RepID=A0A8X7N169_9BASI|nr:hypothetical protein CF328_g637 [Tilletia controversa]KAE8255140.1 hypothetical protein A4X06_0g576 [Tilletia controversa]CAD6911627.1 unnamed protein product [Tilletia controversa]CAD6922699.1 unnamed protein product [Tilletia controversa]CAD6936521.1 unnamed protein product [Tilletia controversa]